MTIQPGTWRHKRQGYTVHVTRANGISVHYERIPGFEMTLALWEFMLSFERA